MKFDFGSFFQGQMGSGFLEDPKTCLLLFLEVWNVKPIYRESWPTIFLVIKFYLASLLQGQMGSSFLKGPKTHLLLVLEVWDIKPTCRKSCPTNLLMGLI